MTPIRRILELREALAAARQVVNIPPITPRLIAGAAVAAIAVKFRAMHDQLLARGDAAIDSAIDTIIDRVEQRLLERHGDDISKVITEGFSLLDVVMDNSLAGTVLNGFRPLR